MQRSRACSLRSPVVGSCLGMILPSKVAYASATPRPKVPAVVQVSVGIGECLCGRPCRSGALRLLLAPHGPARLRRCTSQSRRIVETQAESSQPWDDCMPHVSIVAAAPAGRPHGDEVQVQVQVQAHRHTPSR
ncbi:hypothetical protein T440DRAFT_204572 [Plenodomus tracheiphilus IPT5]|uniref:Uncharacterized protein n=1 Tax=Plenodomus tracheiphilus IPT5 TaxID=1408161 RepID=A0A6A7BIC8_9PLEO|nr:hypothetical protein T440DRAFT_204572 [Plenodomus tracheiphilus IPT5]